jgi:hypothetical protein
MGYEQVMGYTLDGDAIAGLCDPLSHDQIGKDLGQTDGQTIRRTVRQSFFPTLGRSPPRTFTGHALLS